ncbi:hypothetical protein NQZ79_g7523 [Umbelopsis isabellina]|nr:hypothetical protein NQZ79_g7523 [Umbelopsis isabellina]
MWMCILLFSAALVQGLEQCSKSSPEVSIKFDATLPGGYTRFWQLNADVGNQVCHEIGKKLGYQTLCAYGTKTHNCQCTGSWTNEEGLTKRIIYVNSILTSGKLTECVRD